MEERAYVLDLKAEEITDGGTCIIEGGLYRRQTHFRDHGY